MQLQADVAQSGVTRLRYGDPEVAAQHHIHHLARIAPLGSCDLSTSIPRPGCGLQQLHSLNSTVTSVGMEISASPRSGNAPAAAAAPPSAAMDCGSAPHSAGSLHARTGPGTEASVASAAPHGLQRSGSGRMHSPVWPSVPEPAEHRLQDSVASSAGPPRSGRDMLAKAFANMVRQVGGSGRSDSLHSTAPPGDGTSGNDSGGQLGATGADGGAGGGGSSARRKLQHMFRRGANKGGKTGAAASNTTGAVGSSNTGSSLRKQIRLLRPGARTAPMTIQQDGAPQPQPRIKKARGRRVAGASTARPPLWRGPGKKLMDAARRKGPAAAPPPQQQAAHFSVHMSPVPSQARGAPAPPPRVGISQVFSELATSSGHEPPRSQPAPAAAAKAPAQQRPAHATQLDRIARGGVHGGGATGGSAHSWLSDVSLSHVDSGALSHAQVNVRRGRHQSPSHPPAGERPSTSGQSQPAHAAGHSPARQTRSSESGARPATARSAAVRSRECASHGTSTSHHTAPARPSSRPSTSARQAAAPRTSSRPQTPRAERAASKPRGAPPDSGRRTSRSGGPLAGETLACPIQRTSSGRSDAFAPPDSPSSRIPSSPRSSTLVSQPAAPGTPQRCGTGSDSPSHSSDDNAHARRMRSEQHRREQEARAAWRARNLALNYLPGMPKHLSSRIWEDLEDPKFRYRDSRRKNEYNNVIGAVLVNARCTSGHSGRIDSDDGSQSGSHLLDGRGANSSCSGTLYDDSAADNESEAWNLKLELRLPAKANCNFKRSDVINKNAIAVGQGSSAIVFEAVARDVAGAEVEVVIKERRTRADRAEDRAERQMFKDELELCAKLTHRNIVFCHGGFIAPPDAPPGPPDFILFERCDASLSHYLACRYDEEHPHQLWLREGLDVGLSILNALQWIHPDVTHGDLSSSNVLVAARANMEGINSMHVMLADFETARVKHRGVMRHGVERGTPAFMPPLDNEAALLRRGFDQDWLHQNRDVYSTSMIMFHAITGCCPFVSCVDHSQVNRLARYNHNRYGTVLPIPEGLPEQLERFFRDCWSHKLGSAMLARNRLLELKLSTPAVLLDAPCVPSASLRRYQAAYPAVCNPPLDSLDLPPAAAAALARPHEDAPASAFDDVHHRAGFDSHGFSLARPSRNSELARNAALGSVAQRQDLMKISRGDAGVVQGDAVDACILRPPDSSDDDSPRPAASKRLSLLEGGSVRCGGGLLSGTLGAPAAVPMVAASSMGGGGGGIAAIFEGICGAAGLDEQTGRQAPPPEVRSRLPKRRSVAPSH